MQYVTGITVAAAKKTLPAAVAQNPKDTPNNLEKCPYYHPLYCQSLGHTCCNNKACIFKTRLKDNQDKALKIIKSEAIKKKMKRKENHELLPQSCKAKEINLSKLEIE